MGPFSLDKNTLNQSGNRFGMPTSYIQSFFCEAIELCRRIVQFLAAKTLEPFKCLLYKCSRCFMIKRRQLQFLV